MTIQTEYISYVCRYGVYSSRSYYKNISRSAFEESNFSIKTSIFQKLNLL